ncbi:MAG: undecaprenyldiphospho-muramoylpentapeptide beta-N-acetylglucosaminyltransferase [Candidatus Omnitrophica bacterium]|nr:undecaprenyldiphospho-muramoylpentapeptide beta-N-acetylglucosaminyltransferase [Candidatus Omnitrophota bacterium]
MRTLLVAGGTGGHLYPALALAEHLEKRDGPCLILSTARPVDRTVAAASTVEWITVDLHQFTPVWHWLSPRYTIHQILAMRQIWSVIRRRRPDVVVGFGGYVGAAGVAAARLAGLPAVVHEQNLLPGRANRWLARLADAVAVSFPETRSHLSRRSPVEVTGNPVRSHLVGVGFEEARRSFGFDLERPVLLVMGGSQGSRAVNAASAGIWEDQPPEVRRKVQIIHLAGSSQEASSLEEAYRRLGITARVFPFLHEIHLALAAATLSISRAGATAIAEMAALKLPAVLIPYPYAGGHQRANARWMEAIGAAVVLEEDQITPQRLWEEVSGLLWAPDRLGRMREALRSEGDGSAADRLSSLVRRVAS